MSARLGVLVALLALAAAPIAQAVVSGAIAGKAVSTAMDMRSVDEVKTDTEIDAALKAKFASHAGDEFKSIAALVFAGRVALVGFAANPDVRRRAEQLARSETRMQRFKDMVVIGSPEEDSMAADLALDARINAALTAAPGIHSVNMRWKVFGGDVFLMGVVPSRKEAEAAAAAIERVAGVKRLHSGLDVAKN